MKSINGIPIEWGNEDDLNSLFPQVQTNGFPSGIVDASLKYKSFFGDSVFGGPDILEAGGAPGDDTITHYVMLFPFTTKDELENFYAGSTRTTKTYGKISIHNETSTEIIVKYPDHLICCYMITTNEDDKMMLFRLGAEVLSSISLRSGYVENLRKKAAQIIEQGRNRIHFNTYTVKEIEVALGLAAPDMTRTIPKNQKDVKSQLYYNNYSWLKSHVENPDNPAIENAIRILCETLKNINYDVLQSYNMQTDIRYNSLKRFTITLSGLLSMNRRLSTLSRQIKKFQNADFTTVDQLMDFMHAHLFDHSAMSEETRYVIAYPFKGLTYEKRKALIILLLTEDELSFGKKISAGDVLYNLLISMEDESERTRLFLELNATSQLFDLLDKTTGNLFEYVSVLASLAIMSVVYSSPERYGEEEIKAIESKNFFFCNDESEKIQSFEYVKGEKKIKLANEGHWESKLKNPQILTRVFIPPTSEFSDYHRSRSKELEYLEKYASSKIHFDPFEMIVFTAESDMSCESLKAIFKDHTGKIKQDEQLLLPACFVYLIFREIKTKQKAYFLLSTLIFAFLPLSIGGLASAILAANRWGILFFATDIAVDVTLLRVNHPNYIESHPERAKIINTLIFFYALARLGSAIVKLPSIPKMAGKANKFFLQALALLRRTGRKIITGTGGQFRSIVYLSGSMFKQGEEMSCMAACIRQLANDLNIKKTEEEIRALIGTTEGGTFLDNSEDILKGLRILFPDKVPIAGTIDIGTLSSEAMARLLSSRKSPWVASLRADGAPFGHSVIIDKIAEKRVYIRDPWPKEGFQTGTTGVRATISLDEFLIQWKNQRNSSIILKNR
jgi:hypothetical protein